MYIIESLCCKRHVNEVIFRVSSIESGMDDLTMLKGQSIHGAEGVNAKLEYTLTVKIVKKITFSKMKLETFKLTK